MDHGRVWRSGVLRAPGTARQDSAAECGLADAIGITDDREEVRYATPAFGELYELAAALKYLQRIGLDKIEARSQTLVKRFRSGLAARKMQIDTPDNNRSSIVSFYIRKPSAEAEKVLAAERVKVSLQAAGPMTRVRVALAFFNSEGDVDRMLEVAEKLTAP